MRHFPGPAAPPRAPPPGRSGRRRSSAKADGLRGASCLLVRGSSYRFDGMTDITHKARAPTRQCSGFYRDRITSAVWLPSRLMRSRGPRRRVSFRLPWRLEHGSKIENRHAQDHPGLYRTFLVKRIDSSRRAPGKGIGPPTALRRNDGTDRCPRRLPAPLQQRRQRLRLHRRARATVASTTRRRPVFLLAAKDEFATSWLYSSNWS